MYPRSDLSRRIVYSRTHIRSTESLEPDSIASCSLPSPVAGRFTTPVPQPIEDSDIGDEISDDPPLINNGSVSVSFPGATLPCRLPKDLRICLEVIENDLLEGHVRLSKALKNRYEAQLPLVRSLEDVFVSNVRHLIADAFLSLLNYAR